MATMSMPEITSAIKLRAAPICSAELPTKLRKMKPGKIETARANQHDFKL
jgi:hypothetical protein